MDKILLGSVPSFAVITFVWVYLFDKAGTIESPGTGLIILIQVLLLWILFAWLIGLLVSKIKSAGLKIFTIILIIIVGFLSTYFFNSNCDLHRNPDRCFQNKAQATGDITYCKMVGSGSQGAIDSCQEETALRLGDIRLCEGIVSTDLYKFCKENMGLWQQTPKIKK